MNGAGRVGEAYRAGRREAVVFGAALLIRLAHVVATWNVAFVQRPVGDAAGYLAWAQRIAGGEWLGTEAFYQAPAYPYVLGALFSVFGPEVAVVRAAQALWGAASAAVLCWAGGVLFGRRTAWAAGLMHALYGPAVFFDGIVQKAALAGALTCVVVAGVAACTRSARYVAPTVVGGAAGLLALTRENALAWLPVLLVFMVVESRWRQGLRWRTVAWRAAALGAGALLWLVAAGARNAAVTGEWSVSTFQFGPNLYIGNGAEADGRYRPLVRGHETPEFERQDATRLAEEALGRELTAAEVSRYWAGRAWAEMRAAPGRSVRLLGLKALLTWNRYEVPDVEGLAVYAGQSAVLRGVSRVWHFGVVAPLAVGGIVLTRRRWRELWVFYVLAAALTGAVALFYVLARYRFPMVPILVLFAAAGVGEAVDLVRQRRWKALSVTAGVVALVAVVVNWPVQDERRLEALAQMNLGVVLAQRGELTEATTWLQAAVRGCPGSAEAHFNLAQALMLAGRDEEAIAAYREALRWAPQVAEVHFFLAQALERTGRTAEAVTHYRSVLRLAPDDAEALAAIHRLGPK
ncbi:MAG TPA: tetratricopeptide repeat protein [Phycisphaerae bacterium]|nr:tetratricopeptide repeat protein [Phycisphaerae bacterium]HNU45652.1 tetratricopeptide repeat protein [Phycisphaerae bacterium]